ncbi:MAG: 1,4-alpha-glucan branching protein domain-containing protein [Candidatus Geothermincolia bacterium]
MPGCFALTLHTHLPYLLRNGDWPCGEEWILEAWAECYMPLARLLTDLARGEATGRLAMTLTPVLASQLADDHLRRRLAAYLANKVRQCCEEAAKPRSPGDAWKSRVATFCEEGFSSLLGSLAPGGEPSFSDAVIRARRAGALEVLASAATHAHLPLLPSQASRRAQVELGLAEYRRLFEGHPAGFFLPECAYRKGLGIARMLEECGIRYTILNFSALAGGESPECAYRLADTAVAVLAIHPLPNRDVWCEDGLPSHGAYRDRSKRDIEGHGLQYWRVTDRLAPIESKLPYEPEAAMEQVELDAAAFVSSLAAELRRAAGSVERPLIHACFDTELFGHWWFEGVHWLRRVLQLAEAHPDIALVTPSGFLDDKAAGALPSLDPGETSWGVGYDFRTWEADATSDMRRELARCEERLRAAATGPLDPLQRRSLEQAGVELLLLQSSDWPFMVMRDQAGGYARERFAAHLARFERLLEMAAGAPDEAELSSIERTDRLFR